VPEADKARRLSRLLEVANAIQARKNGALEGREMEILVDGVSKKDPRELAGRTRCNRVVNFDGEGRRLYGRLVRVRITQAMPHSLRGTLVPADAEALVS
jgi:tRNA-2-methylthio-N6-dimethylallyladenosine synthase